MDLVPHAPLTTALAPSSGAGTPIADQTNKIDEFTANNDRLTPDEETAVNVEAHSKSDQAMAVPADEVRKRKRNVE